MATNGVIINDRKTVVVVGLGMVGLYFIEKLLKYDAQKRFNIVTFCEESRGNYSFLIFVIILLSDHVREFLYFSLTLPVQLPVAYNRVGLTQYFTHRSEERLLMQPETWYKENNITLYTNDKVTLIDRASKVVHSACGNKVSYDVCIIATGSSSFVPPVENINAKGCFVYRTIDDLNGIIAYSAKAKRGAVIGGGLLGLEAAKALLDLGLQTTIVERNLHLMRRQIDQEGGTMLLREIEKLGLKAVLGTGPTEVLLDEDGAVKGLHFEDNKVEDVDMVVVAAGIRPRDELAKASGILTHPRGGVFVDDRLQTNDPNVFAIGEVVLHAGVVYGLVAPGYEMADVVAANLALPGSNRHFLGGDLSTKLKLLGVHVASFGDYFAEENNAMPLVYKDPFGFVYKKYIFTKDGKHLLGGIMVGDTDDYAKLHALSKSKKPLTLAPGELILGVKSGEAPGADDLPDEAQVCSCNNVSKGQVRDAVRNDKCRSIGEVKSCTKAGTGCGGCLPMVQEIFEAEMKACGQKVTQALCPHFEFTRVELFQVIKIKKLKNFKQIIETVGKKGSHGCEVCKPAVASILASLWNDHILDHATIQDTNDRLLANIQRGGSYSVVPRVPGGEITPEKLIVLGEIAKKYNLYTKITGGQRIDLFGAAKQDLPDIWEQLVDNGFESGHAYGKALRTVKSCVGSTWCRYGIGDSVGFAIRIENRYKGIRAPHKIKGAVSGCIRECAEAQGKDFGLIATDKGYNVYVCGNGGSKPKHAVLLAKDVHEELCIKYLDRFMMYYIHTADRLTRTARWLEKMEGGIEYLRKVIIDDHLGICAELEEDMARLLNTYQCEWTSVVKDPARRAQFHQFANTGDAQSSIEFITERGQQRPADWPKEFPISEVKELYKAAGTQVTDKSWVKIAPVDTFPSDGGEVIKYGDVQIAVFNTHTRTRWYATQNMCPHKRAFVLSQGLVGDDENGTIKVSCPMHKKNFALETGECLGDNGLKIMTFDVKIEDNHVWLNLPHTEELDRILGTKKWMVNKNHIKKERKPNVVRLGNTVEVGCGNGGCGDKLDW
ncbi:9928_t:CDS:2 [Ambispora leptoticha]|uniref:Nitrite reductase [NAD(P)H] n=1 Tax=Ambispora leptoticha TaxID=144679 RepID=A0A9N8WBW3_9GLOM|nr:9928_t:CDS:2 [Ambispora leptoticha]